MPYRKESHYFSGNYGKGEGWFRALYQDQPSQKLGADINPMYYLDEQAIPRILAYDPLVKVILGVREPVSFVVSLYGNMREHGHGKAPITEIVRRYVWPLTELADLEFSLADGFMQKRISEMVTAFGSRLFLYDYKHFSESPLAVLQAIEKFLEVPSYFSLQNLETSRINATGRRDLLKINKLIANQRVLDLVYALVPKIAVRKARILLERINAANIKPTRMGESTTPPQDLAELTSLLAGDRAFYDALFSTRSTLCGDELVQSIQLMGSSERFRSAVAA